MARPYGHPLEKPMPTFHLPLTDHLHDALRVEARAQHRPATEIVREALESLLAARQRQRLADQIQAYASAVAGSPDDLDPTLEAAGLEALSQDAGER